MSTSVKYITMLYYYSVIYGYHLAENNGITYITITVLIIASVKICECEHVWMHMHYHILISKLLWDKFGVSCIAMFTSVVSWWQSDVTLSGDALYLHEWLLLW